MIVHLKTDIDERTKREIADELQAITVQENGTTKLITGSGMKDVDEKWAAYVDAKYVFDTDIQLASKHYTNKRSIRIGDTDIGGDTSNTILITGPCSVESEEQIIQVADLCKEQGINTLRAGCYKPRTSPYSFQGLGVEGLELLDKVRKQYGLNIITEVRDATHVDKVIEYADIVQVGSKAMFDQGILRSCAKAQQPVLIKRGFGASLQEFVQAAEFVMSGGNENVILCERGIRTFETKTRFTLDLCGVAYLKEYTNLPIVLDPSHAIGYAYGVADLTRASAAMGVEGLLIETHPDPSVAKSDAKQQLNFEQFRELNKSVKPVAEAVGRKMV
jgi:3-deoxy-7-phosphoheptulonate synthase